MNLKCISYDFQKKFLDFPIFAQEKRFSIRQNVEVPDSFSLNIVFLTVGDNIVSSGYFILHVSWRK